MRIFTAVRHSLNPKLYYGGLWSGNFYEALRQLGCEILESQVDLLPSSRFMHVPGDFTSEERRVRAQIAQRIIDEVEKAHKEKPVDMFLSYFYNAHFDPSGFDRIHRLGIKTVNFYCNSIYQFELVSEIAKSVNFAWHTEKNARELYIKSDANPVWVQLGADPGLYSPVDAGIRQPKACFVGSRYADRDRWLAALIASGIPLDIYGNGWKAARHKKDVPGDAKSSYLGRRQPPQASLESYMNVISGNIRKNGLFKGVLRTANQINYKIKTRELDALIMSINPKEEIAPGDISKTYALYEVVLNFSNVWADGQPGSRLIPHVRLRDFEAPMCRSCYLTGYTAEIGEFYELGKEIDTYRTQEELADKIKFYLGHSSAASNMREAGYRRAVRDHTWKERFKVLFGKIGLK
ncbi:MAG: glycosyltransferase family 1 protein [Candidatus Omnitrophica bacterium]|nr:glycosyltransferase family 1 protein [Candidatus Omnitrophota bacterium]